MKKGFVRTPSPTCRARWNLCLSFIKSGRFQVISLHGRIREISKGGAIKTARPSSLHPFKKPPRIQAILFRKNPLWAPKRFIFWGKNPRGPYHLRCDRHVSRRSERICRTHIAMGPKSDTLMGIIAMNLAMGIVMLCMCITISDISKN